MNSSDGNTHGGGTIPKGGCNGLTGSAGNSNQKGGWRSPPQGRHLQVNGSAWMGPDLDKETVGQIQVNGQPSGSGSR